MKKAVSFIIACVIASGLTACDNTPNAPKQTAAETAAATAVTDENGNRTATAADFSAITICGTEFTMPVMASDFKGDFSVDKKSEKWGSYAILYKNELIGLISYEEKDENGEKKKINLKKDHPISIMLFEGSNFSVGSFGYGMNSEALIRCLGETDENLKADDGTIETAVYRFEDTEYPVDCVIINRTTGSDEDSFTHIFLKFRDQS